MLSKMRSGKTIAVYIKTLALYIAFWALYSKKNNAVSRKNETVYAVKKKGKRTIPTY